MTQETKDKIRKIVEYYRFSNPIEFYHFQQGMRSKRKNLKNKFATTGLDFIERGLYEIPETLFDNLMTTLSEWEMQELREKSSARWFANTFPDFKLTDKSIKL